jgi:methylmalonyl-CoA mutase cobalamin-binding subunit
VSAVVAAAIDQQNYVVGASTIAGGAQENFA